MSRRAGGAALLLVLLLIAMLAVLLAPLVVRSGAFAAEAMDRSDALRCELALASGLALAIAQLEHDAAADRPYDGLDEPWAQPIALSLEAELSGQLRDRAGLFALSRLAQAGAPGQQAVEQLRRLLAAREGDDADSEAIEQASARLQRWLRERDLEALQPAWRATFAERTLETLPAQPLRSIDGVGLVEGFDRATLHEGERPLARLLSTGALEADGEAEPINLNTAPLAVLMSLAPEVTRERAEALITHRREAGSLRSLAELAQIEGWAGLRLSGVGLTSASWRLELVARSGRVERAMWWVLTRDEDGRVEVLRRLPR